MKKKRIKDKNQQIKPQNTTSKCQICGGQERYPVAVMVKGKIKWACYQCWKKNKEK